MRHLLGQAAIGARHGWCIGCATLAITLAVLGSGRPWGRSPGGCRRGRSIWLGSAVGLEDAAECQWRTDARLAIGSRSVGLGSASRSSVDRPLDLRADRRHGDRSVGGRRRINIPRAECLDFALRELLFGLALCRGQWTAG